MILVDFLLLVLAVTFIVVFRGPLLVAFCFLVGLFTAFIASMMMLAFFLVMAAFEFVKGVRK